MKVKKVTPSIIRKKFNDGPYPALIRQGKLKREFLRDDVLRRPQERKGPSGTRSQYIRYLDNQGRIVVEGHQYLRPDGSLGASGKFDPKKLLVGNELWAVSALKPPTAPEDNRTN